MMIGIVTIGTALVWYNASLVVTISASIVFGFFMTIGLGLLKTEDLKKITARKKGESGSSKKNPDKEKPKTENKKSKQNKENKNSFSNKIFSRFHKDKKNNPKKESIQSKDSEKTKGSKESKITRISTGLAAAIGSFNATRAKKRDEKHTEKIDSLINSTINEPIQSPSDTDISQSELPVREETEELSDGIDPFDDEDFGSLDSLEIDGEEMPVTIDTDIPVESPSLQDQDSDEFNMDNEINSILLAAGEVPEGSESGCVLQGIEDGLDEESFIDLPDSVPDIQTTSTSLNDSLNELENITNLGETNLVDDDFSNFDEIDLDELETDDILIETEEIIIEEDEVIDDVDILPDDTVASQEQNTSEKNSLDFGNDAALFGNTAFSTPEMEETVSFSKPNEFDDILSVLESDIKKTKKGPDPSLLRDLKDVHIESNDLVTELEIVLNSMGKKTNQTKYTNNEGAE